MERGIVKVPGTNGQVRYMAVDHTGRVRATLELLPADFRAPHAGWLLAQLNEVWDAPHATLSAEDEALAERLGIWPALKAL